VQTTVKASSNFGDCDHAINVFASDETLMHLQDMGRTEDIKFSPDCRRLAIAGFKKDKLLILDVKVVPTLNGISVSLTDFVEITSPSLNQPHGLAFIDDETLIVVNRCGEAPIFKIPSSGDSRKKFNISSLLTIGCNDKHKLESPGSVSVSCLDHDHFEILICNNYAHYITRHILERKDQLKLISNEILLSNGLAIPDGIAVNNGNRWIAISNHDRHCVFLYQNKPQLNLQSKPDGFLRNIICPHGVRFTPDDNYVIVAESVSPYVNIYAKNGGSWEGKRNPRASLRVVDEAAYLRGKTSPLVGGVKGIDIDRNMNVMVTTCEEKVLQFFDLRYALSQRGVPLDRRIKYLQWHCEKFNRNKLPRLPGVISALGILCKVNSY
jgi:hypothetical protein